MASPTTRMEILPPQILHRLQQIQEKLLMEQQHLRLDILLLIPKGRQPVFLKNRTPSK